MSDVLGPDRDMKYTDMINKEICDRGIIMDANGAMAGDTCPLRTRPSIHLWKEFSRIWLEITDVRIERLQDITEADAIAEGVELVPKEKFEEDPLYYGSHEPITAFQFLWWEINETSQKKFEELDSWSANPWVWVIGFKILSVKGKSEINKSMEVLGL